MADDQPLYYDGRTARAQPVTAEPGADALALYDEYRRLVAHWPYADIRLVDRPGDGQPVRLKDRPGGRQRLTLPEGASLARLEAHCPDLYARENSWTGHGRRALVWGAMAVASIIFMVAVAIPRIAIHMASNLPPKLETRIGVAAEEQILKALALAEKKPADPKALTCKGAHGNHHLNRVMRRFTGLLNDPTPVSLRVVDLDQVNALALPGRRIIVFRGLIDALKHPNELAGILGHELAHVHFKHPTELLLRETGYGVMLGLVFGDITGGSVLGGAARIATGAAYSRDAEALADQVAVNLMNGAGWDVRPMARFFRQLDRKQGDAETLVGMFMTHPLSKERADGIVNAAKARGTVMDWRDWREVQGMCDPGVAQETQPDAAPRFSDATDRAVCLGMARGSIGDQTEAARRGLTAAVCDHAPFYWQRIPAAMHSKATNKALCAHALDRSGAHLTWDKSPAVLSSVLEAKRRGLSIMDCWRALNPDQRPSPSSGLTEAERIMAKFVNVSDREVCDLAGGLNVDASREAKRRGLGDAACRAIPKVAPPSQTAQARLKGMTLRDLCAGLAVGNPDYEFEAKRRGVDESACGSGD